MLLSDTEERQVSDHVNFLQIFKPFNEGSIVCTAGQMNQLCSAQTFTSYLNERLYIQYFVEN